MILTKEIEIVINRGNIGYYKKINSDISVGKTITIQVIDLPKYSRVKIDVKCSICGDIKTLVYANYTKSMETKTQYMCRKCTMAENNIKKYGVGNVFQLESVKNKIKNTLNDKYGVDNISKLDDIKEKKKKTCKENYGVTHHSKNIELKKKLKEGLLYKYGVDNISKLDDIKEKNKKKCKENYGVEYISQTEFFKEKVKKTNLKKYGIEYTLQSDVIKNKIKKTNLIKYGFENPSKSVIVRNKISVSNRENKKHKLLDPNIIETYTNDTYKLKCDCGENHTFIIDKRLYYKRKEYKIDICTTCNPIGTSQSNIEKQILNYVTDIYNGTIIENDRSILNGLELDIYLPELNMAIEVNGIFWHNELYKSNTYHNNKTNMCLDKNINLFHIYEDEWNYKKDIIKSMILNKVGNIKKKIFGRKCKVKEITNNPLVRQFLNENHLQGFVGSKVKLGLYYNDELVSLMTFGMLRKPLNSKSTNSNTYELIRFCNKLNTSIIGGASKLFKYFTRNYNPLDIISYADRSYSNGNLYKQLGFDFIGITKPNYYYVIGDMKYHRYGFRKDILVKNGYDKNKTEKCIMLERKIYRIYNSGNNKYLWVKE